MFNFVVRSLPNVVSQNIISTVFRVGAWAAVKQRGEKFHSIPRLVILPGMDVKIIPALQDNYMYLIVDNETKEAAVVDPVEPEHVLAELKGKDIKLTKILTTHHHWDHAGGNKKLLKAYPELPVYGGDERVEGLTTRVGDGDKLYIGNLEVDCLHTPCHTKGHICYVIKPKNQPQAVFTGDTLFIAGCGRFFEGTADQMYSNLYTKLGSLPNDTKVFCGHEYTYANLKFSAFVDSENQAVKKKLEWAEKMKIDRQTTVPSTIGEEKETNPFMRVDTAPLQSRAQTTDPVVTMAYIRKEKDNFKAG
ncbi:hydroxyacylglutathione hydrolase, mitochondrial isoform X2 [Macrosteles quadrilineatus]|uniref:hydroxyacylglutathione hydrolase, mitochondrial isoform X2 n=1 Tax=Macrosteles quadrilineatus TaxID=74068 RepID=UPI0023E32647|nr:hydroxyacylglutathione hydrolase, mitochondrial isoform X2 [Macrosteles quadrilineatus]